MKKKDIGFYLLLLVLHLSCANEDIVRIKIGEPKLVINGILSPEQEIAIHLSKSFGSGSKLSDAELKELAIVRVYINDQFSGVMIPEDKEPEAENDIEEKGNYRLAGVKPLARDEIRIEAEVEGYPIAVVTTRIPDSPVLLTVDTVRYLDAKTEERMRLYVKMEDAKEQRNYYRILLSKGVTKNGMKEREQFPLSYSFYYYYPYSYGYGGYDDDFWFINYEDPAFTADLPIQTMGAARINEYGIFSDNLFNGNEYVLKLSFTNPINSIKSDSLDLQIKYNVKLVSVSESYYHYYKRSSSLSLSVGNIQLTPLRDNYMSYSNVINGLGLVFSCNETKYEIEMPDGTS
ncbi:DUF4249 domain-containing protein [Massilibacteroides vaginae]|uniref:DUF4249 domain-containing protein n=1 Tax=Massilibacteroides vaginae TaxID=1673718 RepID=UPI000A1CC80D|nr:DUF4249 domain-containing protein [Massilibacteroides vaginae]